MHNIKKQGELLPKVSKLFEIICKIYPQTLKKLKKKEHR